MILHNLKFVLRSLWTKRLYASIILLSLIVGFVCTNILISFLVYETNTDSFHHKKDRIFQIFSNDPFGGTGNIAYVPDYFYEYLTSNYAEIENVCQLGNLDGVTIKTDKSEFHDFNILSADSSFFSLFDFPIIHGSVKNCLNERSIVLSKEKAIVLFGTEDVVGSIITLTTADTTKQVVVSAVVDTPSENSHLSFDALLHHSVFPKKGNGGGASYALLSRANNNVQALQQKINQDGQRPGLLGAGKMEYYLKPLTDSYFNADNKMTFMHTRSPMFIRVGYIVCGLIMFIASFNFINLFLLFWQNRRKEIGIKKTLGISPGGLFGFSLIEAGVYILISYALALMITGLLIPVFNSVFEANLSPKYFLTIKVVSLLGGVLFLSGALVVIIAVAKQWSMKPISLMKRDSSKVSFNRLLFTLQFVISITLAICSITIIQQMNYIESAPLGFNRSIIQLNAPDRKFSELLPVLKQKLAQLPAVNSVSVGSGNPISGNMIVRYELEDKQFYTPYLFGGDNDFMETLNLKLIEGELPSEKNNGKLVNQRLVQQFNLKKPIGEKVPGTKDLIVGVVEDFTCGSFKQEIPPVIISYYTDGQTLLIDYAGNDLEALLPQINKEWKSVFPDNNLNYRLLQQDLMKKYKEDTFFYRIIITFSIISMVLSCFGLFALSWAVIQSRTKEMGIRKVLGATAVDVLNLLTLTFTKRILVAFLLAAPVGYYLMNAWLARFANRIELSAWVFMIAGGVVIAIAFVTLSFQTIKATLTNPVDEIRNE
jgi:putative ABC transport system permease protein